MDKESAIEILECIKDDFSDMMPECLKAINYAIALILGETPECVYNEIINILPKLNSD